MHSCCTADMRVYKKRRLSPWAASFSSQDRVPLFTACENNLTTWLISPHYSLSTHCRREVLLIPTHLRVSQLNACARRQTNIILSRTGARCFWHAGNSTCDFRHQNPGVLQQSQRIFALMRVRRWMRSQNSPQREAINAFVNSNWRRVM